MCRLDLSVLGAVEIVNVVILNGVYGELLDLNEIRLLGGL